MVISFVGVLRLRNLFWGKNLGFGASESFLGQKFFLGVIGAIINKIWKKIPMKNILFCDDDGLMQKIAGKFLGDAGTIFPGGQELFDCHKANADGTKYCIVDLNMPDPDGYATLELIRKFDTSKGRVTRVIALSGDADEEECQAKVKESGFDGLIGKPLNKNKLAALD